VPAHTIAYVSNGNQTIVYVNPTDQALSIGDSGLHEVHLAGVATVHLSDFALAATTTTVVAAGDPNDLAATMQNDPTNVATTPADVSSDATVSRIALLDDFNWTVQTTSIGDSFDTSRGHIDYAKFASFDESGTASSEFSVDDALIILPSGLSIELPQVARTALMQTNFAFDQKPVFDSTNLMTLDHGAVMHGPILAGGAWIVPSESDWKADSGTSLKNEDHEASIAKNAGPMNAGEAHAHEIDTGPNVVLDSGVLKTPETSSGNRSIASEAGEHATPNHGASLHAFEPSSIPQVVSGGTVGTSGDSFHFKDEISGSKGSGVNDVAGLNGIPASMNNHEDAAGAHGPLAISEGGETPATLGDSFHFKDEISGFKGPGVIDLAELNQSLGPMSHREGAAETNVPPAISDGAQAIGLPSGQHPDDHFNIVPDHAPSALVTHVPHDLIV
jgi:hypothetical protein